MNNNQDHSSMANGSKDDNPTINHELQQHLQTILDDLQLDDAPAGGALVVYQHGHCIAKAAVGMAQLATPWQADTLSLNFSTGKGVLATLVHVLVSNGLLSYDAPIAQYWPAFGAKDKEHITLRQVLSHQANLFAITSLDADSETLLDWEYMLEQVAGMPVTEPDSAEQYGSAYSALVYGWVLGGLIEAATDLSLADALRQYLTEPLGIADDCYFGLPTAKLGTIAQLVKHFEPVDSTDTPVPGKRNKPVLKAESAQTLATYATLPSYQCWQQAAINRQIVAADKLASGDKSLNANQINRLYFDHSQLNLKNYKSALIPNGKQLLDYHDNRTLQSAIPAANNIASANALATIYAMLASGGQWQDKTIIDGETFAQLSTVQTTGLDAVMPTTMDWRLGYHQLLQVCPSEGQDAPQSGFGHMGYNGSVAWCDPEQNLSFAFVHNFDVAMLNDIRQFALTEAVLAAVTAVKPS